VAQQLGIATHTFLMEHHDCPDGQMQLLQLSWEETQSGLTGKQALTAEHQLNPVFKVKQLPQLS